MEVKRDWKVFLPDCFGLLWTLFPPAAGRGTCLLTKMRSAVELAAFLKLKVLDFGFSSSGLHKVTVL